MLFLAAQGRLLLRCDMNLIQEENFAFLKRFLHLNKMYVKILLCAKDKAVRISGVIQLFEKYIHFMKGYKGQGGGALNVDTEYRFGTAKIPSTALAKYTFCTTLS